MSSLMTDNRGTAGDKITGFIAHLHPVWGVLRHTIVCKCHVILVLFPTERPSRYMNISGYSDENTYKAPGN